MKISLSSYDEKFSAEMAQRHHEPNTLVTLPETIGLTVNFKYDFDLVRLMREKRRIDGPIEQRTHDSRQANAERQQNMRQERQNQEQANASGR